MTTVIWGLVGECQGLKSQLQIKQSKDLKPDQVMSVFLAILRGLPGVFFFLVVDESKPLR